MAYTYGLGPEHYTTDSAGNVVGGVQLQVWTAPTGTQITALLDWDGVTALPGVVTSKTTSPNVGRWGFKLAAETYPVVWIKAPGLAQMFPVVAQETTSGAAAAVAGFPAVQSAASAAQTAASSAQTAASTAQTRSTDALAKSTSAVTLATNALNSNGGFGDNAGFDLRSMAPTFVTRLRPVLGTVMQHSLKDTETGEWYMSQASSGTGVAEHTTVSRMTEAGVLIDSMTLTNAGHGTIIDLQRIAGVMYIWTSFATVDGSGVTTSNAVARVKYAAGTKTKTDPDVQLVSFFTTSYANVVLDIPNDYCVVRISSGTAPNNYDTYYRRRLSEVLAGVDKVVDAIGPFYLDVGHSPAGSGHIMQGYTFFRDTLFRYTGTSNGSDPHRIGAYAFPGTGTETEEGAFQYAIDASGIGREPDGTNLAGFNEPEGISVYRHPSGRVSLMVGKCTGPANAREYKLFAYSQADQGAIGGTANDSLFAIAPVLVDRRARRVGGVTSMMSLLQPGWYYINTAEFAAMTTDRPTGAAAGAYFLEVSGYEATGTTCVQTLTQNTSGTPAIYTRVINFVAPNKSLWQKTTTTAIAYSTT